MNLGAGGQYGRPIPALQGEVNERPRATPALGAGVPWLGSMLYTVKACVGDSLRRITVEAGSKEDAVRQVVERLGEGRATILGVAPVEKGLALDALKFWERVGPRDLEFFCRQMHAMLAAGITVVEAVESIASRTEKKSLKEALEMAADSVREGFPLSAAFRANPRVFPPILYYTLTAAEETGALDDAMKSLAEHFLREARFKERMRQAMAYPSLVVVLVLAEVIGLFTFVVPRFVKLLKSSGASLPLPTRLLLAFASNINSVFAATALLIVSLALILKFSWKNESARKKIEAFFLKTPVLGRLVSRSAAAHVCRSMALMLRVGIPIVRVLEIANRMAVFTTFGEEILSARDSVRQGGSLAGAFSASKWLPQTSVKMMAVGESSGRLDEMLEHSADLFETEVDLLMQKLPPVTEAVLVVLVGGMVLFVLLSVFLPILSIYKTIH